MRALITGSAGFIGSHLADQLLGSGHEVVGVDAFTDTYAPDRKWQNLAGALHSARFRLIQADLLEADLRRLLGGCDIVFHLAGEPGVRQSWGADFLRYAERNLVASQRLLEATRRSSIERFVFASSSSVYGAASTFPLSESLRPRPISPYGVTKLAAEELCYAYARSFGLPVVVLRYFTVYGPRQRPDMAFSRFIAALEAGQPVTLYGDGEQRRDFTFVDDIVAGTIAAVGAPATDQPINLGSGTAVSVAEALRLLGELLGRAPQVCRQSAQAGDMCATLADIAQARALLDYAPRVSLVEGLARQWAWQVPGSCQTLAPDAGSGVSPPL